MNASTGALTIKKVGAATVIVTAAETATYAQATKEVIVTVNKATPTVTAPTAKTLTYNGQKQELVNAGSTNDGTLYYAVTTENTAPTDENLYTTSIPTVTDAGSYYVWYKVVGDNNHNDTAPDCVTVSVLSDNSKKETDVEANVLHYDGTDHKLVKEGTAKGGTMMYALGTNNATAPVEGWSDEAPSRTEVGTYYVWYMVKGDKNHNDTEPKAVEVKILAPIFYTVTFKVANGSWDDGTTADKTVKLEGFEGDTLSLTAEKVPAVSSKPAENYKAGAWDKDLTAPVTADTSFTYTYAQKPATYECVQGSGESYVPGPDGSLTFVFKRSNNDEETFSHFDTGSRNGESSCHVRIGNVLSG